MPSPEDRAKKKMKEAGYNPVHDDIEEEATKEIMKSEIKNELAKIGLKAMTPEEFMDEIIEKSEKKSMEEDDTWDDSNEDTTMFYDNEEVPD